MIEVVSAVIVKRSRLLLVQRPYGRSHPYRWCTPGGKVEGNESHHQALRRELREELGLEIEIESVSERALWSGTVDNGVFVLLYPTWIGAQAPRLAEAQPGLGWFERQTLAHLPMTPADERARVELTNFLWSAELEAQRQKPMGFCGICGEKRVEHPDPSAGFRSCPKCGPLPLARYHSPDKVPLDGDG